MSSTVSFGCRAAQTACLIVALAGTARAQTDDVPVIDREFAVPVEIVLETVNGEVRCGPPQARLPAKDEIAMRFLNRSKQPIIFSSPDFFAAAEVLGSDTLPTGPEYGTFPVAPESSVRVKLLSPPPDEYGYVCHDHNEQPSPQSSGYLVVGPLEADAVEIPPRPRSEDPADGSDQ